MNITTKKRVLLKLGGSSLDNPLTLKEVAGVIRGYQHKGFDIAILHGAGQAVKDELHKRGIKPRFVSGFRQTTPDMMEVIANVLENEVHPQVVENLKEGGFDVVSVSGCKDRVFECAPLQEELMHAGEISAVDIGPVIRVWAEGRIPVVTAIGFGEPSGQFNVSPDWAATDLAIELHADELVFLTDQEGVIGADQKRLREVHIFDVERMIQDGIVSGGMSTKVQTMLHGFKNGVKEVRVLNSFKASEMHEVPSMGTRMSI